MDGARMRENVQDNLAQGIGRVQERLEERVRRGADQAQGMFASFNDEFGSFVRESPVMALTGAFAVGYLIAKVARAFK